MSIYRAYTSKFLVNKYSKTYYQIIDRAIFENRKKTKPTYASHVYYELHHVLPRSVYPEFINLKKYKWNGVLLTAREHFIAHKLLVRMMSTDIAKAKMLHAVMYFITSNKDNRMVITSREYEYYRSRAAEAHSLLISEKYVQEKASSYGKKWYTNPDTGRSMQYVPESVPQGYILGRKSFTKENNSVGGTKWYHSVLINKQGMYKPGEEPTGWIKGRLPLPSRGKGVYYNQETGETRRFKSNEVPPGWLPGNFKLRGRNISDKTRKKLQESNKLQTVRSKGLPRAVMCNGQYFASIAEANRVLNFNVTTRLYSSRFPDFYFVE